MDLGIRGKRALVCAAWGWDLARGAPLLERGVGIALLGFARISGETAPLLFTALNNQFFSLDMTKPMASLPAVIFQYARSAYDDWRALAWAGALLIALAVLTVNILGRVIAARSQTPR